MQSFISRGKIFMGNSKLFLFITFFKFFEIFKLLFFDDENGNSCDKEKSTVLIKHYRKNLRLNSVISKEKSYKKLSSPQKKANLENEKDGLAEKYVN